MVVDNEEEIVGGGGGRVIFFAGGGGEELGGAGRFKDFFPSGDELDFRCLDEIEVVEGVDNSFPILLHA